MLQKIKNSVVAVAMLATLLVPSFAPALASADSISDAVCSGTNLAANGSSGGSCGTNNSATNSLSHLATRVVNFLSIVVGVVAVVMIIVGGFRYITSGGESSNVSGAKNTLIYAIVGLVIVALAQFIVHFVLGNIQGVS